MLLISKTLASPDKGQSFIYKFQIHLKLSKKCPSAFLFPKDFFFCLSRSPFLKFELWTKHPVSVCFLEQNFYYCRLHFYLWSSWRRFTFFYKSGSFRWNLIQCLFCKEKRRRSEESCIWIDFFFKEKVKVFVAGKRKEKVNQKFCSTSSANYWLFSHLNRLWRI